MHIAIRQSHLRHSAIAIIAFVFVLIFSPLAYLGAQAEPLQAHSSVNVLVKLHASSSPQESAKKQAFVPQANHDELLHQRTLNGSHSIVSLSYPDYGAAERALETLNQDPSVEIAEIDQPRHLLWEPVDEASYDQQRNWIAQADLPNAWNISSGSEETVVAVIDSGVSPTHPDLVDRLLPGISTVEGSPGSADINGHGTHVAGIIAADGSNGIGTAGTAMDVRILPIRVLDSSGSISVSSIVEAIYDAIDAGVDVINLSLGAENPSQIEHEAIQAAVEAGIPVVAASGNKAGKISYPASYPETLSIGAVDSAGDRAEFSSVVSLVDVAAPGVDLFSPDWSMTGGDSWSDRLNGAPVSGTSFSSAVAAGVVALMKSVNPDLSPERIREILTSTAIDSGAPGLEAGVGHGEIDAEAAVKEVAFAAMYNTWLPADNPVASGQVTRTWLWGADPTPDFAYEAYDEAQHDVRLVYYYDKSRMELTDPFHHRDESWYVTNGLLVNELITGKMQVGDDDFEMRSPAQINIAGDPDDTSGPTYAAFNAVLNVEPTEADVPVASTISRDGAISFDTRLAQYGVTSSELSETTNHRVASVFWDYLNGTGLIEQDGELVEARLFDPWFYATGLPITEPYWARVKVAGVVQDVLIQCFERRCMTYTPGNAEQWRVEMGNVGQHYYTWRYDTVQPEQPALNPPTEGDIVYESTLADWPNQTFAEGTSFFANGGYHIRVTKPGVYIPQLSPEGDYFTDFGLATTVKPVGHDLSNSEACLIARTAPNLTEDYALCIDGAGNVEALFESADEDGTLESENLLDVPVTVSGPQLVDGVELKIVAQGHEFWFTIDEDIVGHAHHEGPLNGRVGVYVINQGDPVSEFTFTNMIAREIS